MRQRTGYSRLQIVLHWATAGLVVLQYLLHEGVADAFVEGLESGSMTMTSGAALHMAGGALILGLAIWRLALRSERPPPSSPAGEPGWAALVAPVVHAVFYVLLIGLPVTGALAWGLRSEFLGDTHEALRAALLFLIVAHLGAIVLHQSVWRTGILRRMMRPDA